jgi:NADH-quinone oxidoreductase subunit M
MDIDVTPWFETAALPLLGMMTLLPLATILPVAYSRSGAAAWRTGLLGMLLNLALGVYLIYVFDPHSAHIQLGEQWDAGIFSYRAGADGANILFIPLTALISVLALLYAETRRHPDAKQIVASLLAYEAILIGAFSALNTLQFWFWCVLEMLPVVSLILCSGTGKNRHKVLTVFLQFWASGLLMVFAGFVILAFNIEASSRVFSFDWLELQRNIHPIPDETLIFVLLFYGFAVRMPLFPFHAWLPLIAEHGTVAGASVFLAGLKLGVYALLRFVLPLVPGAAEQLSGFAVVLGLTGIFYGAVLALMQINLRRLLAFAVVSHTGMLAVGAFCLNDNGLEGTLLLTANYGLASAGLLLSLGLLYNHTRTAMLPRLGDLFDRHTALALLFLVAALSTMAMPGTPGFDAAHQLLDGVIEEHGWLAAIAAAAGNVLAAAFLLWAFQRVFLAERKHTLKNAAAAFALYERSIAATVCAILIGMSFYIAPWITYIDSAVDTVREHYDSTGTRHSPAAERRHD